LKLSLSLSKDSECVAEEAPMVSIIIPVSASPKTVEKCLASIYSQDYPRTDYEVILVGPTNHKNISLHGFPVREINADVTPGAKRNIAVKKARGAIIALCDDDVTVHPQWLKNLVVHFKDPAVAVVGGPNENPLDATLKERCSGYIFSSFLGSASMSARYQSSRSAIREADETDLISCNMAVKKSVMEKCAFPENIWPNEENIFCYHVKKNGYKLLYDSNAIVWHQRRPIFLPHLRQVFRYGRGRGQMMRLYPESKKDVFLLPSFFMLSLLGGFLLSLINSFFLIVYIGALLTYAVTVLLISAKIAIKKNDYKAFLLLPLAFFLHHCTYGLGLLCGILFRRGKSFK
jgi:succinoglycan biosynthesis protein ExoA